MAKLSNRQKFLRESRSSNSNSWGFSESQLDQLESMYGKGIKQFYEIEKTPPQQLSSKRRNFLSMTGKLSDYSSARLGGRGRFDCGIIGSPSLGSPRHSPLRYWPDINSLQNDPGTIICDFSAISAFHTSNGGNVDGFGEIARYNDKLWVGFKENVWTGPSGQYARIAEYDFDVVNLTTTFVGIIEMTDFPGEEVRPLCSMGPNTFAAHVGSTAFTGGTACIGDKLVKIDVSNGVNSPISTVLFTFPNISLPSINQCPGDMVYLPSDGSFIFESNNYICHIDSSGAMIQQGSGPGWIYGGALYPSMFCSGGTPYITGGSVVKPISTYPLSVGSSVSISSSIGTDSASNPECCDPGPPSWDCSGAPNYTCSDPGAGLGQYTSLSNCQAFCAPPSWDCDPTSGGCYDPGNGNGQYTTLNDCESNCFPPTWRCTNTNQGCLPNPLNTDPAIYGPNVYYSLQDCENDCYVKRWTCTGRQFAQLNCVMSSHLANAVPSGPGIYSSPGACNANCNQTTWNCTLTGCVDPGDQSGQYFHLNACEDACTVYQCQNLASQGPSTGSIPGCVPFQGGQVTLNAGLSAGQLWYNNIWDCQAHCYNPSWNCKYDPGQVNQLPTWNCVDPLDGSGSFSLLVDCQNNCGPDPVRGPGYDCDDALGCIPHVGPGQGQYTTLAACQAAPGPCYKP